jgi:hypothetical protein
MKSSRMRAKTDKAKTATRLLVALTGKANPAKAAEGDEPVFAYKPLARSADNCAGLYMPATRGSPAHSAGNLRNSCSTTSYVGPEGGV